MTAKLVASTAESLCRVRAAKVGPRLFEIAQFARKDFHRPSLVDSALPRQRDLAVRVPIEEREGFDDDRNGSVKFGAGALQNVPLLPRGAVERITGEREGDPRSAIDENSPALAYQRSSWTLSCSIDERFGSPSQIATNPPPEGLSTTFRIASRTTSAMLRPVRRAAARSASSSSLRR